jgi:hypothetical protein
VRVGPHPHLRSFLDEMPVSPNGPQAVHPVEIAQWTLDRKSRVAIPFVSYPYIHFVSQPVSFDILTKYPGGRGTRPGYVSPPASPISSTPYGTQPAAANQNPHGKRDKTRSPHVAVSCHSERSEESLSRLAHADLHTPATCRLTVNSFGTKVRSRLWRCLAAFISSPSDSFWACGPDVAIARSFLSWFRCDRFYIYRLLRGLQVEPAPVGG